MAGADALKTAALQLHPRKFPQKTLGCFGSSEDGLSPRMGDAELTDGRLNNVVVSLPFVFLSACLLKGLAFGYLLVLVGIWFSEVCLARSLLCLSSRGPSLGLFFVIRSAWNAASLGDVVP